MSSSVSENPDKDYDHLLPILAEAVSAGRVYKLKANGSNYNRTQQAGIEDFEFVVTGKNSRGLNVGHFEYIGTGIPWDPRASARPRSAAKPRRASAVAAQAALSAYKRAKASGAGDAIAGPIAVQAAKSSYAQFFLELQAAAEAQGLDECNLQMDDPTIQQFYQIFTASDNLEEESSDPVENDGANIGGALVKYKQKGGGTWDELKRLAALLCSVPREALRAANVGVGNAFRGIGDYLLTQLNNGNASRFFYTVLGAYPVYKIVQDIASPDSYIVWGVTTLAEYLFSFVDPRTSISFWWGFGTNVLWMGAYLLGLGALGASVYVINATMKDIIKTAFWWAYEKLKATGRYIEGAPAHIRAAMTVALDVTLRFILQRAASSASSVGERLYSAVGTQIVKGITWAMPQGSSSTTSTAAATTSTAAATSSTAATSSSTTSMSSSAAAASSSRSQFQNLARNVASGKMTPAAYEEAVLKAYSENPDSAIQRAIANGDSRVRAIVINVRNAKYADFLSRLHGGASNYALLKLRRAVAQSLLTKRPVRRTTSGSTKRTAAASSTESTNQQEDSAVDNELSSSIQHFGSIEEEEISSILGSGKSSAAAMTSSSTSTVTNLQNALAERTGMSSASLDALITGLEKIIAENEEEENEANVEAIAQLSSSSSSSLLVPSSSSSGLVGVVRSYVGAENRKANNEAKEGNNEGKENNNGENEEDKEEENTGAGTGLFTTKRSKPGKPGKGGYSKKRKTRKASKQKKRKGTKRRR